LNLNKNIKVLVIAIKKQRHRYIYFIVESSNRQVNIEKTEIFNQIKTQCKILFNKNYESMGIRLIIFNGKEGIIKCFHTEKENTIKLLNSIKNISLNEVDVKTIMTSGTIKTLIGNYKNNKIK